MQEKRAPGFSRILFESMPIVGILRGVSAGNVAALLPGYIASGLTTVEITMNSADAVRSIREAVAAYSAVLNVGAGTVKSLADLEQALEAGASFIVTPIVNEEVIKTCVVEKIPVFPGAYTPTEIYRAWDLGADIVKVFPATTLGPGYFRDVKAPLNEVRLMPTGGVSLETIPGFYEVGAAGFGIGGPLFKKDLIDAGDWEALTAHFSEFSRLLRHLRGK